MSRRTFTSAPDWLRLVVAIEKAIEMHREEALTAGNFESKEYERGWVDALRSMIDLPDQILSKEDGHEEDGQKANENEVEKEDDAAQEEKGVIPLVPNRKSHTPRRTEFFRG